MEKNITVYYKNEETDMEKVMWTSQISLVICIHPKGRPELNVRRSFLNLKSAPKLLSYWSTFFLKINSLKNHWIPDYLDQNVIKLLVYIFPHNQFSKKPLDSWLSGSNVYWSTFFLTINSLKNHWIHHHLDHSWRPLDSWLSGSQLNYQPMVKITSIRKPWLIHILK